MHCKLNSSFINTTFSRLIYTRIQISVIRVGRAVETCGSAATRLLASLYLFLTSAVASFTSRPLYPQERQYPLNKGPGEPQSSLDFSKNRKIFWSRRESNLRLYSDCTVRLLVVDRSGVLFWYLPARTAWKRDTTKILRQVFEMRTNIWKWDHSIYTRSQRHVAEGNLQ